MLDPEKYLDLVLVAISHGKIFILWWSLWTAVHVVAKRARERAKTTTIY